MARLAPRLLLALLSVVVLFEDRTAGSSLQTGSATPVRIDLKTVNSAIAGTRSLSAEFLDDSTIAVVYTSDGPQSGGINLHLTTIDLSGAQGRQLGSVALGPQVGFPTLAAAGERQLFVAWKQEATLYDVNLGVVRRVTIPSGLARVLPGGEAVVLWPDEPAAPVRRIDMRSMSITDVQTAQGSFDSMSGAFAARRDYSASGEAVLSVRAHGGPWRPVALPAGQEGWCCGPIFVSPKLLIDGDRHGRLFWIDAESATWTETSMGADHRGLKFITSTPDGRRFAAVRISWRWIWIPFEGSGRFEWRDGAQVYDIATRKPIFTKDFDVSWWMNRSFGGAVAIAPSGNRLLVYDKTILEIYDLPK